MASRAGRGRRLVVDRTPLIKRVLRHAPACTIVVAPAGYGKSRFARLVGEGFGRAAICDVGDAETTAQLSQRIVLAMLAAANGGESDVAQAVAALGAADESGAHDRLLQVVWSRETGPCCLVLDNVERIVHDPVLVGHVAQLALMQNGRKLIINSRVAFESPALRRLPPNELLRIGVNDLQFTDQETRDLLGAVGAPENLVEEAVRQSGGWPIAALVFARAAENGSLVDALAGADTAGTILEYVTTQAFDSLDDGVIELLGGIARLSPAGEADLQALGTTAEDVQRLASFHPFFAEVGGTIVVHPLAQKAFLDTGHGVSALRAAAAAVEGSDPVAAARLYVSAGDHDGAARLLGTSLAPFLMGEMSVELARIVGAIDRVVIMQHPSAWAGTAMLRSYAGSANDRYEEARSVWRSLTRDCPLPVRLSVGTVAFNNTIFMNHIAEGAEIMRELNVAVAGEPADSIWRRLLEMWEMWREARAGRRVAFDDFRRRSSDLLSAPTLRAVFIFEFDARDAVLALDRDLARCRFDNAVENVRATDAMLYRVTAELGASFFAWLAGEDALHERYLAYLRSDATPAVVGGASYYLACCDGSPTAAIPSNEIRYQRVFAAIIGASRCENERDRREMAEFAIAAATDDGQPLCLTLAWLCIAFATPARRIEALGKAREFAEHIEGGAWTGAIKALAKNVGPLVSFRDRFEMGATGEGPVIVRYARRTITGRNPRSILTAREFSTVVALASAGRPIDSVQLATMLFPDDDRDAALKASRVWISRVRAKFPDFAIIRSAGNTYELAPSVKLDVRVAEEAIRQCDASRALSSEQRDILAALVEDAAHATASYLPDADWAEALGRRYREVRRRAGLALARDAQDNGNLKRAEALLDGMLADDPIDEDAASMLIALHTRQGSATEAERVRRSHERALAAG